MLEEALLYSALQENVPIHGSLRDNHSYCSLCPLDNFHFDVHWCTVGYSSYDWIICVVKCIHIAHQGLLEITVSSCQSISCKVFPFIIYLNLVTFYLFMLLSRRWFFVYFNWSQKIVNNQKKSLAVNKTKNRSSIKVAENNKRHN